MNLRYVGLCLLGGSAVYVAMAACTPGGSGAGGGGSNPLKNPVPDASADPEGGSRLKPTYRVADDGAKEYVPGSWYDSQRHETCSFATANDGKTRCLPDGASVSAYSDAACTNGIAALKSGCTAPVYGITAEPSDCHEGGVGLTVYSIGALTQVAQLYVSSGTTCLAAGPAPTGFDYYKVGAEIPATSFLAASVKHD